MVRVELNPTARQGDLVAALEPIVDRLRKRYEAYQEALRAASLRQDTPAVKAAQDELDVLGLFKNDGDVRTPASEPSSLLEHEIQGNRQQQHEHQG